MKKPRTLAKTDYYRKQFLAIKDVDALAELLQESLYRLELQSHQPSYRLFKVPKRSGGQREIEDPSPLLKRIQKTLNIYLQAVYFFLKTDAAYGFVMNVRGDGESRQIISNAQQHLGCNYLLNMDIKDFFHQISIQMVQQIFMETPFNFEQNLVDILSGLCTHQGRLPMGAPTSPVLSNFAAIELDKDLLDLANWSQWTYTRYADDMSFSAQQAITESEQNLIKKVLLEHGFTPNQRKLKYYTPADDKIVTGLLLQNDKVALPKGFMEELQTEIQRLQTIMETAPLSGRQDMNWIDDYEDRIEGLINFASMVRGEADAQVMACERALRKAMNPPDDHAALSWLDFPYF